MKEILWHSMDANAVLKKLETDIFFVVSESFRMKKLKDDNLNLLVELKQRDINMKSQLKIAKDIIQSFMMPVVPNIKNYDISIRYQPLYNIGGDLYHIMRISEDIYAVLLIDICGHGVPAALLSIATKMCFDSVINNSSLSKICSVLFFPY